MKAKYGEATKGKTQSQQILDGLTREFSMKNADLLRLMENSRNCVNRLREIALRPNALTADEHFKMMIESEKLDQLPVELMPIPFGAGPEALYCMHPTQKIQLRGGEKELI